MKLRNIVLNSVTHYIEAINGHTSLVCWYLYCLKPTFECLSLFQRRSHCVLKGATIKGKNMLPI